MKTKINQVEERDGSVVKSNCCFFRGLLVVTNVILASGNLTASFVIYRHSHTNTWYV